MIVITMEVDEEEEGAEDGRRSSSIVARAVRRESIGMFCFKEDR